MNRSLRIGLTAASIVAVALLTTGCPDVCCNTARGGGSIVIREGDQSRKATFGFQLVCKPTDNPEAPKVSGQFEYQDHGAKDAQGRPMKLSIHGVATGAGYTETQCSSNQGMFTGTYKHQPENSGLPGTFTVSVVDNGQPGPSDGDTFALLLTRDGATVYEAQGTLTGGNIKTF